jgi:CBS domain-containing protein
MNVSDVMTHGIYTTSPDDSVQEAAQAMADLDTGVLSIGENDRLIGILTDRDLSTRVVAEARNPTTTFVRDVMSTEVRYCFEYDSVEEAAEKMSQWQVRRLPVLSREQRVVGIISLGDLAREATPQIAGGVLSGIAESVARRPSAVAAGQGLAADVAPIRLPDGSNDAVSPTLAEIPKVGSSDAPGG